MSDIAEITNNELSENRAPGIRPTDEYYISSASAKGRNMFNEKVTLGKCLREQWYRMKGYPVDREGPSASNLRQMALGDVVSEFEADLAKKAGIYLGHEVPVFHLYKKCRIKGYADLLCAVENPDGTFEKIGVEYKSVHSHGSRRGTIDTPKGVEYQPKIDHTLQAACYLKLFRDHFGFSHWQVIYIDRGTGDISLPAHRIYLVGERDEISVNGQTIGVYMEDVFERWATLREYIKNDTPPPRDYELEYSPQKLRALYTQDRLSKTQREKLSKGKLSLGDFQCQYCNYRKTCWGLNNEE